MKHRILDELVSFGDIVDYKYEQIDKDKGTIQAMHLKFPSGRWFVTYTTHGDPFEWSGLDFIWEGESNGRG